MCLLVGLRQKYYSRTSHNLAPWVGHQGTILRRRLTAITISIAVPEEPCLDPRELPIQQQLPLLIDGQNPCVLSNQQPKCSGGNDDYLNMFRELITDELQDTSGAGDIAQPHSAKGLDPIEVMSEELLETAVDWETPGQDVSSGIQFDSMFQPNSPSLAQQKMEFSYSDDQHLPFDNLTQVDDGQQSHGSQDIRMDEDRNTDIVESEDVRMHNCSDRRQNEHSRCDSGHHQAMTRKSSPETSCRPKSTRAANSSRKRESVTSQRSGLNPMRAAQKRTGTIETKQPKITKAGSKSRTSGSRPFLEKETACLEACMSQHRTRYEGLGLPCPGDFVDSEETKIRLASLRLDDHANVLKVFSFTIGGCESLVGLKEVLRAYREPDIGPLKIAREVSNAKRLETIQSLGGKEAYLNLLKKCHIHRLFTDNIDPLCNSNDSFIVSTAKSVATRARGELGNPRNSAESRITKSMMKEVYPEVDSDSADYSKKYCEITRLRRSGRRLELLVSRFGRGILGLLPLAQDDSSPGLACKIRDTMQVLSSPIFRLD